MEEKQHIKKTVPQEYEITDLCYLPSDKPSEEEVE